MEVCPLPKNAQLVGDEGLASRFYDWRGGARTNEDDESNKQSTCVQHLLTGSLTPFHGGDTQPLPLADTELLLPSAAPPPASTAQAVSAPASSRASTQ